MQHLLSRPALRSIGGCVAVGLALWGLFGALRPPGQEPPRLWRMPSVRGSTHAGQPFDDRTLAGRVIVADFIYTQCSSACPALTAKLLLLARKLDPRVELVSFSVDPDHDTPSALARYAKRWAATPLPWTLVALTAEELARLAEGMSISVERTGDDDGAILHTNRFFLIDGERWVRGSYDSSNDVALADLTADAARLVSATGRTPDLTGERAFDGGRSYASLGCAGCHEDARVAPPLRGLWGRAVRLSDGKVVRADRRYLRDALIRPSAELVAGYPATMPSYAEILDDVHLEAVLSHLASMGGAAVAEAAATALDPVCHMPVAVVGGTPRWEVGGQVHYFCSDGCRERFRARREPAPATD